VLLYIFPDNGTYGTGKTTFSLNFIWEGLKKNENVIYISLEESKVRIQTYMEQKGWKIEDYLDKSLHVLKLDPTDFNLANNRIKKKNYPNLSKSSMQHGW
jgi:archaellum biogenesis ATPase FlaH